MALPPPSLGSTVLVTGASSGIGAELASELAGRGYNLTLTARRAGRLEALGERLAGERGVHVAVEPCDLADAGAREALVDRLGSGREVVGVCNNAGRGSSGRFFELSLVSEAEQVRINVEALHHLTGALLAPMVAQGVGAILNVASVAGFYPVPGMATYAATKAFVVAFSEAVHAEVADRGVSVTCLCPGPVHTEFGAVAGRAGGDTDPPEAAFLGAGDVARAGVEGMVTGRRTVIPGAIAKATAVGGRIAPRSLLLGVAGRFALARAARR